MWDYKASKINGRLQIKGRSVGFITQDFFIVEVLKMKKAEIQNLNLVTKDFRKELGLKSHNHSEVEEKENIVIEKVPERDFSTIFARLKRSSRKKSASIL